MCGWICGFKVCKDLSAAIRTDSSSSLIEPERFGPAEENKNILSIRHDTAHANISGLSRMTFHYARFLSHSAQIHNLNTKRRSINTRWSRSLTSLPREPVRLN